MKNRVKIENTDNGVKIKVEGDIQLKDVEKLTESCNLGTCDCSTDLMDNIDTIETSGEDGEVTISLSGNKLDSNGVAECMSGCDCGF